LEDRQPIAAVACVRFVVLDRDALESLALVPGCGAAPHVS